MDEKIIGLEKNKDIDRRLEETTKELQREREKLMAVIRMSGDLIFEYDIAKDQMHYAGPEEGSLYCGQITEGYTEQLLREVDNRSDAVEQQLAEALHSGEPDICIELCKTDEEGNPHWMKVIGQTFYNEKKEPERVLGKVCDIDAQKKKERELQEKSQRDSLTGLLNHSTIKQQITHRLQKMKRGQVGYLIVLDVDSFKKINDTNGHLFGDAVLCSFADEMNKLFPEALKGRIGGDEFVCYVENMPREELEEKLGQLNRCMSDRYDDDKTGLHISCSLGAAVTDGTVTDYNLLFQWADVALYQVKSREKGAYDLLEVKEGVALPGQSYLDSEENKEDEIVHKEAQFESAEDLVLFCMDLLENVPNLTSALKVISERTCSFFNIDDMICVEVNEAGPSIRYQWNREEKKNFVKRILHPGVFEWDRIRKRADESGAAIYRQSETPDIYKEEAESVMIVMSTASKGLKASVIFSDRHTDRTWEEEKNALCRISHQIFNRLRMLKNAEKDQRELNRKLNYDALTGLPVYNKFVDKLEAYMAANGKTGLYFVSSDFSNFQYVNEMYGYEVGDRILHDFAVALQEKCKEGVLFCRVTSDHFVGVLKEDSVEDARQAYLTFTNSFVKRINSRYDQCNLVIATGLYGITENDWSVSSMMDNANEARKQCKTQKVDSAVGIYTDKIRRDLENTRAIVSGMVSAYNNKEFHAYLQPKVSLHTGKVVGAEALVRWIKADGTMVMPGKFIDIFERNGFITKVDFAILDQVMEYLRDALAQGEEVVPISVNFSRRHNEYADFVPNILKRLKDYKVPSDLLEVEVTESVFMSDLNKLTNNLETLRDRGVEISVDDFGSGYSSLNLLSKVAVDTVKLDKQFLDDTMNSEREETALTIIKYLTKMLRHLGFKVLAEGVETSEQLEMLRLADCDIVQGYFYAKPMPIGEFRTFLQEFNERDN
ncbi:MAG: EAL domain-containing protein [Lachnospiraceae bacterium]